MPKDLIKKSALKKRKKKSDTIKRVSSKKTRARSPRSRSSVVGVAISSGDHRPSAHVLKLKLPHTPRAVLPTTKAGLNTVSEVPWWVNELAVMSFLGFCFWIGLQSARVFFRIPIPYLDNRNRVASKRVQANLAAAIADLPDLPRLAGFEAEEQNRVFRPLEVQEIIPVSKLKNNVKAVTPKPKTEVVLAKSSFVPGLAQFAVICLTLVVPIWITGSVMSAKTARAEITRSAISGLQSFASAGNFFQNGNFSEATVAFNEALNNFSTASAELSQLPTALKLAAPAVPEGRGLNSAQELIEASRLIAEAGSRLSMGFDLIENNKEKPALGEVLVGLNKTVEQVLPILKNSTEHLDAVDAKVLPEIYQDSFTEMKEVLLPGLKKALSEITQARFVVEDILALDGGTRRYLIMFQNDHELRASGGFLGSFALADVSNGVLKSIEVPTGGTYDTQGQLTERVISPQPLHLINPRWEMQDANWWVDWPTSAQKIGWFYEHSGGSSVDGVLAIDTEFIESLLAITGPITVPGYETVLSSDNFVLETQRQIKTKKELKEPPKQIISDAFPLLFDELLNLAQSDGLTLLDFLSNNLQAKHLLIYRDDPEVAKALDSLGWAGSLPVLPPRTDALAVVHTNIAGQKTDSVIDDTVAHTVKLLEDGTLEIMVTVTRDHRGFKGDPFSGVRNVDYMRLYVPLGSRLVNASGFEKPDPSLFKKSEVGLKPDADLEAITTNSFRDPMTGVDVSEELGYTVFGNWLMVDPGEQTTVSVTYRLPWRLNPKANSSNGWLSYINNEPAQSQYSFYWHKQPGTTYTTLNHAFKSEEPIVVDQSTAPLAVTQSGWTYSGDLTRDAFFRTLFH